tara:strand:+ start:960 stop:2306 length:1347 start_codon:yes stop_codon:yes gene_type:complete
MFNINNCFAQDRIRELADEQYRAGNYVQAIQIYDQAILVNPQNSLNFHDRGVVYGAMKNYERAITDMLIAESLNPRNPHHFFEKGRFHYETKAYEMALAELNHAIVLDDEYAHAYLYRGKTLVEMGREHQGLADLKTAVRLKPAYDKMYLWAATKIKNHWVRLESVQFRIDELGKTDSYHTRAHIYSALKKYDQAIADFDRSNNRDSSESENSADDNCKNHLLKRMADEQKKGPVPVPIGRKVVVLYPADLKEGAEVKSRVHTGQIYTVSHESGDWYYLDESAGWIHQRYVMLFDEAAEFAGLKHFERRIKASPADLVAMYSLGSIKACLEKHDEAIIHFLDGLSAIKNQQRLLKRLYNEEWLVQIQSDFIMNVGNSYLACGGEEQAIHYLTQALEISPHNYEASYNRGLAYALLGQQQKAIRDLNRTLELNPKYMLARRLLQKIEVN